MTGRTPIGISGLLLLYAQAFGQGENNHWYFGFEAGLDFNTSPPTALTDGMLSTIEGCATVSNAAGELLFYTDGTTVWDRQHAAMPDGTGLLGGSSSSQSALIVPIPGHPDLYYVCTVPVWGTEGNAYRSTIDMSLNGGYGDIVPGEKNMLFADNATEKLVAVAGEGASVWVLTKDRDNALFRAYQVTSSGMDTVPVLSEAGSPHVEGEFTAWTGVMKVSPDRTRLALATLTGIVETFAFSATTGIVSDALTLPVTSPDHEGYGVCFSPNSQLLYVSEGVLGFPDETLLYQYDLSAGDTAEVVASKTLIASDLPGAYIVWDMAIGPDGIVYVSIRGQEWLSAILDPNALGVDCAYEQDAVFLEGATCASGLPNPVVKPAGSIALHNEDDDRPAADNGELTGTVIGDVLSVRMPGFTGPMDHMVIDLSGKFVLRGRTPCPDRWELSIGALMTGVYQLMVVSGERRWSLRFSRI
jgi:hypothetical protein